MNQYCIPKDWSKRGNIITVIGVGGGGGNAVSYMFRQGIKDVDFIVCNTDCQALEMSPVPVKLQLGEVTTKGLGAGTDFLVGRKAAQESVEEISNAIGKDTQMVFLTCGMGGGTGTGATPVIAQVAREKNLLVVGVVTIPFRDEGEEALYRAVEGIKELSKYVDCTIIIDNQKLYQLFGQLTVTSAFPKADEVLATAVKSIAEIITCGGYINVDFADVKKVMQNSGMGIMGIGTATGPDRAQAAVEQAFNSPLLNDLNLNSVKNALVNITCSKQEEFTVKMEELSQIMAYTKKYTGNVVNFKRGIVFNDDMEDAISVTIIATGFEMRQLPVIEEPSRGNHIVISGDVNASETRRHGTPLIVEKEIQINKRKHDGKPLLLTEDPQILKELELEAAYLRVERMQKENQTEQKQWIEEKEVTEVPEAKDEEE